MEMDLNNKFTLYPCCIPCKGHSKASLIDLQRNRYKLIPLALYSLLTEFKDLKISGIMEMFKDNSQIILDYYNFLLKEDWGILERNDESIFNPISTAYHNPKLINYAIFDYSNKSLYSIPLAINKLEELHCENLEIRFYDRIGTSYLSNEVFPALEKSSVRNLELLIQYNEDYTEELFINMHINNPRLSKVVISESPQKNTAIIQHNEITIIYTSQKVDSEQCCGVIKPWNFTADTSFYTETINYNNCLNAKISVDQQGNIKNCPSMKQIFGHINTDSLKTIAESIEFQKYWRIKKDDIFICKECEFRYICQDCRAYTQQEGGLYAKPSKCCYNPINN